MDLILLSIVVSLSPFISGYIVSYSHMDLISLSIFCEIVFVISLVM